MLSPPLWRQNFSYTRQCVKASQDHDAYIAVSDMPYSTTDTLERLGGGSRFIRQATLAPASHRDLQLNALVGNR